MGYGKKPKAEGQEASTTKEVGWICPVCGRGVAPWKSECGCVYRSNYAPYYYQTQNDNWWKHRVTCKSS